MFKYIGAAVGKCAETVGCGRAPDVIYEKLPALQENWFKTIYYESDKRKLDSIDDLRIMSQHLADATQQLLQAGEQFITFGGDHSCAIGTWSGVAECYDEFGLIWLDAHLDAHTPETSLTGNLHGMPLAVLLGHGDSRLVNLCGKQPKLKPQNIILLGIRSYEPEELELLTGLGVRVYHIEEVERRGFATCFAEAKTYFEQRQLPIGVSFDLDGLDPSEIAAVGTPVEGGLRANEVITALATLDMHTLIGLEIAEYNPTLDTPDRRAVQVIERILAPFHLVENGYLT